MGGVGDHKLRPTWPHAGGPREPPPAGRGFGTTLIERTLSHELDAEVHREFLVTGLRCTLAIPLTQEIGRLQKVAEAAGEQGDDQG